MTGNVIPPFKVDIAGAFIVPPLLKDAREQYRNGQITLVTLRAIEDAEIRNLVEQLKVRGMKVATDGRFRSDTWLLDFMCGLEGIRVRAIKKTSFELIGRIDIHRHPLLDNFTFLTGITGGDMLAKQALPAPSRLLSEILKEENNKEVEQIYSDKELLLADIVSTYRKLITDLYDSGCRYIQFDDTSRTVTEEGIAVNNNTLKDLPPDLYIAFHAPTEMLFAVDGIHAFFLDYDSECCGKNRLLWFIREKKSTFGFVLSHYPIEEELDDLRTKIEEVTRYIPLNRFSLCLPDVRFSPLESPEEAWQKQWDTLRMASIVAKELWPNEE